MPDAGTARRAAPRLLFVGSDRPAEARRRHLPALLEALPEARLDLVGPFARRLPAGLRRRRGARHAARRVSTIALSPQAYAAASLVVHPAVGEAFGLVPFEAALCGTAAVVAGGHGCGEWFARAGGCVVPPDEPLAHGPRGGAASRGSRAGRGRGEGRRRASRAPT